MEILTPHVNVYPADHTQQTVTYYDSDNYKNTRQSST